MPELPEVETVRAGLAPALIDATISAIEIRDARSLKRHPGDSKDFVKTLKGAKILGVVRRGKFLWMPIEVAGESRELAIVGHLGMSGQMLLRAVGEPEDKLTRVVIRVETKKGKRLEFRFIDQRLFGSLAIDELVATEDGGPGGFTGSKNLKSAWLNKIPTQAAHIRRDPLDANFDLDWVLSRLKKKSSGIKRVLLDQQTVSGIGNIYADEALWASRLHYDQPADSISTAKAKELFENIRAILARAVGEGGTSFDEKYKNVNGESGYFAVSLNAYGQTGLPCARCGKPIRRDSWMNRGSHYCPNCQKLRG
ncbi:MAG: bifunctional DNA-formamidopyrimidine glycosylase/DNA-(apurinic or apyrimidinic site) lyase [Rhodoluna sp.]